MRSALTLGIFMTTLFLAGAATAGERPRTAESQGETILHVFTWEDYFDSNVVNEFQKKYNCVVSIDSYDSNDSIYSALTADGAGYDVVTPSSPVAAVLHRAGLLMDLDHDKLPNLKHLDNVNPALSADPDMVYSAPYTQTITGIGYNKTKVPESALTGWDIFANSAFANRSALLEDMREVLGAALKQLGYSLNSTDPVEIEQAGELVKEWRKNAALLDLNTSADGLANDELLVVHGYNGDIAARMSNHPELDFFVPPQGAALNSDDFVIPANTPLPDLAHAFINHMLDPEMAKQNMETILFYMPNASAMALLDDNHILKNRKLFGLSKELREKCEVIIDLGPDNEKYEKEWAKIGAK